jgi:hypothetical protein
MTALDIDIEPTPLKKTTPSSSARSLMFHRNYKWLVPLFLGIFAISAYFVSIESKAVKEGFLAEDVTVKYTSSDGGSGIASTSTVGKKKGPGLFPTKEPQNPLLSFPKMLLAFQQKRQEWFDQLEKDYGKETFKKLLLDHGRTAIRPPNEDSAIRPPAKEGVPLYSNNRMHRKIMIKLLEAQEAALNQRSQKTGSITNAHEFPKFIWASGGHRYAI